MVKYLSFHSSSVYFFFQRIQTNSGYFRNLKESTVFMKEPAVLWPAL
jgi:hypothetical protein